MKNRIAIPISIIVALPAVVLYLYFLSVEELGLLGIIFIFIITVILVVIDFRFLIYLYFLFGALASPGFEKIGGLVTVGWVRNTILVIMYSIYLFFILKNLKSYWGNKDFKTYLYGIIPFIVYISISFLWSSSPIDSFRYIPKYILAVILSLVVILDDKITVERALKFLIYGTFIFLILSTIGEIFKEPLGRSGEYFEGFSGRHQSKYYLVFIIVFLIANLAVGIRFVKSPFLLASVLYSFILLIFILQRGAFLALFFSFIYIYIYTLKKANLKTLIFLTIFIISFIFSTIILLQNPRFQEYTFRSGNITYADFFTIVSKGDIISAINLIAFKGRLEMWEASFVFFTNKIIGTGLATVSFKMEQVIGQYMELHNDFLQYLIEGGYIGFGLFLIMWFSLFKISWKYRKFNDKITKLIALSIGAYTSALFIWSLVDHVLNYAPMNFAFLLILVALLIKRTNKPIPAK